MYNTVSTTFWDTFAEVTAPIGLNNQIQAVENFNTTYLIPATDKMGIILDKVYYFIPQEFVTAIITAVIAIAVIRLAMAIANFIWW